MQVPLPRPAQNRPQLLVGHNLDSLASYGHLEPSKLFTVQGHFSVPIRSTHIAIMSGHTRRGGLVVVEGLDRSGKSSQCQLLVEGLNKAGKTARYVKFPGRCGIVMREV